MNDDELFDLLGAYAVGAIDDPAERLEVEALVERSPAAAQELRRHEAVLAALANGLDLVEPPESVWTGTMERISARATTGASPAAGHDEEHPTPARVTELSEHRSRRWVRFAVASVAAVAAVAVGIALWPSRDLTPSRGDLAAALEQPGSHGGELSGSLGGTPVRAAVALRADGSGIIVVDGAALDAGAGKTFQLWALEPSGPVSVGVLGQRLDAIVFSAPAGTRQLAISVEDAPGAETPNLPPVAAGSLA